MKKLREIVETAAKRARQKRAKIFRENFVLGESTRILDIGSETGENINLVLENTEVLPENVFIADIDAAAIKTGREKFGFNPVLLDESGELPFEDNYFDIIYCSSVIEHLTVQKKDVWEIISEEEFQKIAWKKQRKLANEIARVGRQFFVQTPAKYFPIESHSWLPFFAFFPRPLLIKALNVSNKFWIKQTLPDFNLLNARQMKELFPQAEIVFERKFGLIKSIMAIKSLR